MSTIYQKDPLAKLSYTIDWADWLAGDTIAASEWIVPDGVTLEDESHNTTSATVLLSGGDDGCDYCLVNKITTTTQGLIDLRGFTLQVRSKLQAIKGGASLVKETLAALDAMLAGKATLDQKAYTINNRSLERYSPSELIEWRKYYATLYEREQAAERATNGDGGFFPRVILDRFTKPGSL